MRCIVSVSTYYSVHSPHSPLLSRWGGVVQPNSSALSSLLRCSIPLPGIPPGQTMSEGQVSLLLHRLGLYARRGVQVGRDGRILGGRLDYEAEILYQQLFELHDAILERQPLAQREQQFLAYCRDWLQPHLPIVRQLEREYA